MTKLKMMLFVALLGLAPMAAKAQSSTQGAPGGTVFAATEAVVPKAPVTIHNDATTAVIHVTTDDSGYFKAPLLEPGTYTVIADAAGFREYRAAGVIIQVGQLTSLIPHLTLGASTEMVNVTGAAPVLNFEPPGFSSNLNGRALANIPINNRRWSSLALLTPGVVQDTAGFGLVSVRGSSTILNTVLIDGADDNQAYFAEERGRTREAYSTSGTAVREFEVNTGVYVADFRRAAGGVINSVTKSGSNWSAISPSSTLTTLNATAKTCVTASFKPEDMSKIYGFTMEGKRPDTPGAKDQAVELAHLGLAHVVLDISCPSSYGVWVRGRDKRDRPDVEVSTPGAVFVYFARG
jgi:hypothetical protein